ncbi:MAG: orotate phosphoribosyltransferase [Actinomycetota bacterium]|nr:orotate phosphoribosyltransferase [Actinomycetota bacterium]
MSFDRGKLAELVSRALIRSDDPIRLSSGDWSHDYIDGKRALAPGEILAFACNAVISRADELGATFDAVGGLTMGADPIAHGVALLAGATWFSIRKELKPHGNPKLVEGAELSSSSRVLLVDDIVTTGSSILTAFDAIKAMAPEVVLAIALVDRGETARRRLTAQGVPYEPLLTYRDLEIDPVGGISPLVRPS